MKVVIFFYSMLVLLFFSCNKLDKQTKIKGGDENSQRVENNQESLETKEFSLKSSSFNDNQIIPLRHTMKGAGGSNISPQLSWSNFPSGTKSFALCIYDDHPIANRWIHWLIVNIPVSVNFFPEGATLNLPKEVFEANNSFGFQGYGGPEPPVGSGKHKYIIKLFALDTEKIQISQIATINNLDSAISGHLLKSTFISGFFER